jgi:hypothetical protein
MVLADPIAVTLLVAGVLEHLGIPYLVGGSLASSLQGIPRATHDVDLVADLNSEHVEPLEGALRDSFYVDAEMIREAIRRRASFNIIYLPTMLKVDIFVLKRDPLSLQEMARRQSFQLGDSPSERLMLASAEDIILQKLDWFRRGGEISDRQWNDVLGVLKVGGSRLDVPYLRSWAPQLNVSDLLERALQESGML